MDSRNNHRDGTSGDRDWSADQPIVAVRDIHKSFGSVEVLKGISFDVMKGQVICIIGPSGSGKSTLIRCINGLTKFQSGSIKVEGQEVNQPAVDLLALRKKVGIVFQQYNLFQNMTVLNNITVAPTKIRKRDRREGKKKTTNPHTPPPNRGPARALAKYATADQKAVTSQ